MKKLFLGTFLLALAISVSITSMARPEVNVSIDSATAHRICSAAGVIVLPDTMSMSFPT